MFLGIREYTNKAIESNDQQHDRQKVLLQAASIDSPRGEEICQAEA